MVHNGVYYCDAELREMAEEMGMDPPPDGSVAVWKNWAEGFPETYPGDILRLFQRTVSDLVLEELKNAGF